MRDNPARYVADQFGGYKPAARAISHAAGTTLYAHQLRRWANRRPWGAIPPRWHRPILLAAQRASVSIKAGDLISTDWPD